MKKIVILSGKGGAGKTTVTLNLSSLFNQATVVDCDVEEPNIHLFFPNQFTSQEIVYRNLPEIDQTRCTHCGKCSQFCQFNALITGKKKTVVIPTLCHDCGGCALVCPEKAISFVPHPAGEIFKNHDQSLNILYGLLHTGERSAIPVITTLKNCIPENSDQIAFLDAPPGAACSTVTTLEDVDYALIVVEATPFGISDFKLIKQLVASMEIPYSIVINKATGEHDDLKKYCRENSIKILGIIPADYKIATLYATGKIGVNYDEEYRNVFKSIKDNLLELL